MLLPPADTGAGRVSDGAPQQNMLIYPQFARAALEILGNLQAKEDAIHTAMPSRERSFTSCVMASLRISS
jgi:hypothetical protein